MSLSFCGPLLGAVVLLLRRGRGRGGVRGGGAGVQQALRALQHVRAGAAGGEGEVEC